MDKTNLPWKALNHPKFKSPGVGAYDVTTKDTFRSGKKSVGAFFGGQIVQSQSEQVKTTQGNAGSLTKKRV
jgi:hypothetical protein